jgi:glycosyltransferase involved in cell wall biosynthesis
VGTKENKNLSRLIRAIAGLPCHLHIVGRPAERQIAELRAAEVDFSTTANLSTEQMYDAYCQADLLSFGSTYEGFGLPILEANAVGRPVVTSNISSMPEVAGNAACLVDPFDVEAIRAGILRVINDQSYREQLVRNGLKNVTKFTSQSVAEQYLTLYRELAIGAPIAAARCAEPALSHV